MLSRKKQKGFTFIELLIVISMSMIFLAVTIPVYGNWQGMSESQGVLSELLMILRRAREYSLAGYNNSQHGVFIEENDGSQDRAIYYQGESYVSRDSGFDLPVVLSKNFNLVSMIEGDDINFFQDTGEVSATGTISFSDNQGDITQFQINEQGIIIQN